MIIKQITIKNFRSYYGEHTFDISDRLTIFIGNNGDGKTTLFDAFDWVFDTVNEDRRLELFSAVRRKEMEVGTRDEVKVSITFEHDGEKTVEKSFSIEKTDSPTNPYIISKIIFNGYTDDGSGRKMTSGRDLMNSCFDAYMQRFSMFKGESDLNVFNDPDALKQLVSTFSDLKDFDKLIKYAEQFEADSEKAFDKENSNDKKNSREFTRLNSEIQRVRRELSEKTQELEMVEQSVRDYTSKIENREKYQQASEQYKEITDRIANKEDRLRKAKANLAQVDMNKSLLDRMWILCCFSPILQAFQKKASGFSRTKTIMENDFMKEQARREGKNLALDEIKALIKDGAQLRWDIPDRDTMIEMINAHQCKVCGTLAPEGSDAYKYMVARLQAYEENLNLQKKPKEEEHLFKNEYIDHLHNLGIRLGGDNAKDVAGKKTEIYDRIELNERYSQDIRNLQRELDDENDEKSRLLAQSDGISEAELKKTFSDIKGTFEQKSRAQEKVINLQNEIKDLKEDLSNYNSERDKLTPSTGMVAVYGRVHGAFDKILKAFKSAKTRNYNQFIEELEAKANEYQKSLSANDFTGVINIVKTVDDSARIILNSADGEEVVFSSGSQDTTTFLSVLFAISDIATLKRDERYPMIFDAATSSMADEKENEFYNIVNGISKQCIIITKDFLRDGELRYDAINNLDCMVYRIQKEDSDDLSDLRTIKTNVTRLK